MKTVPTILAAYDKKRGRIFVLSPPFLCAVKKDDIWYQCAPIPLEEIDEFYDLITDFDTVNSLIEEAKTELNIPAL